MDFDLWDEFHDAALTARVQALEAERLNVQKLREWMQGEMAAASRIINMKGAEDAQVYVATGLHAAYRASLTKLPPAIPPASKETE